MPKQEKNTTLTLFYNSDLTGKVNLSMNINI